MLQDFLTTNLFGRIGQWRYFQSFTIPSGLAYFLMPIPFHAWVHFGCTPKYSIILRSRILQLFQEGIQVYGKSIVESHSGEVQAMIHVWKQWLYNYKEKYTSVQERGGSIQLVQDQSSLLSALLTYRLQVKVNSLGPEWNCKPLLRESLPQQHSCCYLSSIRSFIDHKCYWSINGI